MLYGGRNFLRRILDAMNSLQSPSAKYIFTSDFYADLNRRAQFLVVFNGKKLFLHSLPVVDVQTDVCHEAAGGFVRGNWHITTLAWSCPLYQLCILITRRLWLWWSL